MALIFQLIVRTILTIVVWVGVASLGYTYFKRATTKTGVELFLDCVPDMEKVTLLGIANWLISLVLFDVPALLLHLTIEGLRWLVIHAVQAGDKRAAERAAQSKD